MKNNALLFSLFICSSAALTTGCGPEPLELPAIESVKHEVQFVGGVYDAATGQRIKDYGIEVLVGDDRTVGQVDSISGRFVVGPIGAFDDYTIVIPLQGYREFRSHNAFIGLPAGLDNPDGSTSQSRYFDAYVFPASLETAASQITVQTPVDGETVDGQMRLRPTGVSSLGDSATDTPAGVAGQVWQNDEDLLGGALNKTLTASQVALETGELVYGVEYQIDIYGVAGYQPFVGTYVAGIDADKTFSLTPENADPLSLISSTKDTCKTISDQTSMTEEAVVEMVFNYEVGSADSNNAEVLDDNFTLSPSSGITFKSDDSPDIQERGTQLEFDGVKLVFSFVPGKGIATPGMDPVTSAQYQSLDNFFVQRKGKPTTKTDLASLVGSTTIVCDN